MNTCLPAWIDGHMDKQGTREVIPVHHPDCAGDKETCASALRQRQPKFIKANPCQHTQVCYVTIIKKVSLTSG